MSIKDHNLTLLNSREDWTNWINSIEDLAVRNDVWSYCDPEGIENLVFTATKPSDSASKDTIQKYHSLQAIYDSERKKYDKVSDRIDLTVCQEFKQHYLGIHDVRGKLIALADSIQPTAKDQKQNVRTEFEKLKKGLINTSLDKWLSRWPALVNNAKRYKIENLSESQICDAFIKSSREVNPPFYNYIKSKEAQVKSEKNLVKEAAKTMEKISNAFLTALNEINPGHASSGSVTILSSTDSKEEENGEDNDVTIVQKAQNTVNRALKTFRKLNPTLSEKKITIGFYIKQFRTMAPPKEKAIRGRAAHATLQGRKHNNDSDLQNEGDQPQQKRQRTGHSSSNMGFRNCICGMSHKYTECYYLNPSVKGSKRLRENIERNLKRSNIDLPKFWPSDTTKNQPKNLAEDETSSTDKFLSKSRAAFVTSRFAFGTTAKDEYGDCFRLDNCADTHVCNDLSRFTNYTPLDDETIEFGNSGTHITGIGNVTVHVDTPTGSGLIQLENVAYVPGFHWNLINTHSLEQQGLYFNTRTCWMEYSDGSNAFKVTKHGAFRVAESHIKDIIFRAESHKEAAQSFAMATKSRTPQVATASMDTWHARLGHIRKEALEHMPQAVEGVALGTRNFERKSELCPECQLGQAYQQISRIPPWRGTYPFEKIHLDLIDMEEAFNADSWVAHFYCDYSAYHITFNLPNKNQDELLSITQEFLAITNDNWGFTTRYIQSDGEKGLGKRWKYFIAMKGITFNSSPPDTPDQNGLAERSGGVIIATALTSIQVSSQVFQQSLETLLGISSQRKSLKQQLDAASIKAESGRTTLADLPTVQIGCKRYIPEEYIANKNRKGRRSWIQAYGFFLTEVSPDLQTLQTYWACSKCDECGKSSLFVATNTTSPIEHLRRSHMITEADGNAYEDSSRADSQPPSKRRCLELPTARSNVNKAKELTVGWIVTANLPFTAPSNPYLRRMLDLHDASLAKEVPWSRQSSQRLALALTCGLLQTGTLFLGLHAHYLDASYQVQSRLLALRRVWGAHSGDNQATTIYDIFGEYGIRDRIGAGVCDNVSSNDTCLASLYRQLSPAMAEEDIRNNRTRCFGHIVNLAARAFLWGEDPDSFEREAFTEAAFQVEERELRLWRKRGAVGKLHNIVRFVRASPQRRELMKSLACSQRDEDDYHLFEEDRAAIDLELMQNNETRWNSTFMMIQRAIRKREQIDHFITNLYQ
ncbi:hypothetical protein ACKAV7_014615 [Fusarium commune]